MPYRDLTTNKFISKAKYEEMLADGQPVLHIDNHKRATAAQVDIEEDEIEAPRPSEKMKPGPKKVSAKTQETAGEVIAAFVKMGADKIVRDERKQLEKEEAKSIGLPLTRIGARHLPAWLKKYMPAGSKNDDLTDLSEIGATLAKWVIRAGLVIFDDMQKAKDARKQQREQREEAQQRALRPVEHLPQQAMPAASEGQQRASAGPGVNPLIAAFGAELGAAGVA